jgi:hypothetical protein
MTMRPAWLEDWLSRNTPPCREVVRIISDEMDRPVSFRRRIGARFHFLICSWCLRYQKQIELIRALLRTTEPGSPTDAPDDLSGARLSDEARERLKRLTRQDRS